MCLIRGCLTITALSQTASTFMSYIQNRHVPEEWSKHGAISSYSSTYIEAFICSLHPLSNYKP